MERFELHIVFDPTKPSEQFQVNGCINSEPMALWLMEKAKDVIKAYTAKQAADAGNRILTPTFIPPNLNGGGR